MQLHGRTVCKGAVVCIANPPNIFSLCVITIANNRYAIYGERFVYDIRGIITFPYKQQIKTRAFNKIKNPINKK
jgi:ferredoxin